MSEYLWAKNLSFVTSLYYIYNVPLLALKVGVPKEQLVILHNFLKAGGWFSCLRLSLTLSTEIKKYLRVNLSKSKTFLKLGKKLWA